MKFKHDSTKHLIYTVTYLYLFFPKNNKNLKEMDTLNNKPPPDCNVRVKQLMK